MEKQVQLSRRLQAVVDLVTRGKKVADVGCDHAYISIYMVEQKIASHVIAMDVNRGPLERAKENIKKFGLDGFIETRLSDGIKKLEPGEAETLLIAGMGGPLMQQIILGNSKALETVDELVLQPQSEIKEVRVFLAQIGFGIVEENMVLDEGKYYVMMRAKRGAKHTYTSELDKRYGKYLLEHKNEVLKAFLQKELKNNQLIFEKLSKQSSAKSEEKKKQLMVDIEYCKEALSQYEG